MSNTTFKSLADTTLDSVEGYRKAIEKAKSPHLKQALQRRLEAREATLESMNGELRRQGDELVTKGTVTGDLHRLWTEIADLFENGDQAAAERVEEGEYYIKAKFEKALKGDTLSAEERAVVQSCFNEIAEGEAFGNSIEKLYD